MPMKEWLRRLEPMQLYVVLGFTILFFITELVVSHITHALTLLLDSYHTLCNIFALAACLITVKYGKTKPENENKAVPPEGNSTPSEEDSLSSDAAVKTVLGSKSVLQEHKLKNTFGWARVDVVGMLMCCVFLASLCFSILVEALQTLAHINHHDAMHQPLGVLGIGILGILLNGFCYMTIGGYTFHQGSFLYISATGCVVLNRVVTNDAVKRGERRLSRTRTVPPPKYRQRQGFREMLRDVIGCLFVITCALLVYFTDTEIAKYVDPILSLISAGALMILSYPYMKESCLILLQTIPDTVNIDSLRTQLLQHFPDIINVHDLHVWQLTASKVISTAHIIFQNPTVYNKITESLSEFFMEHGITQVTIQPEFFCKTGANLKGNLSCLMQCQSEGCKTSHCCPETETKPHSLVNRKWKSISNESLEKPSTVDLKSIKIDNSELPILQIYNAGGLPREELPPVIEITPVEEPAKNSDTNCCENVEEYVENGEEGVKNSDTKCCDTIETATSKV